MAVIIALFLSPRSKTYPGKQHTIENLIHVKHERQGCCVWSTWFPPPSQISEANIFYDKVKLEWAVAMTFDVC